jgi:hypothetical protein
MGNKQSSKEANKNFRGTFLINIDQKQALKDIFANS